VPLLDPVHWELLQALSGERVRARLVSGAELIFHESDSRFAGSL